MHAVLERLMVSSLSEASDPLFLEDYEVEAILYYGSGGVFPDNIKLYHRKLSAKEITESELQDGITFLRESLSKGRRVLAVGQTGATIVTAYLTEMGFSTVQALQMMGTGVNDPKPDTESLESHDNLLRQRASTRVHE